MTDRITRSVLEWIMQMLGRAVVLCARGLLRAGVSPLDIDAKFQGGGTVEHPDIRTERALVFQVLEHEDLRSRAELLDVLGDIDPQVINDALGALEVEGIVFVGVEGQVWASRCIRHLDRLGLIGV
jgi:hypothetical protein